MSCDIAAHDGCESKQVSNICADLLGKREGKNPASFKDPCAPRALLMQLGHPAPRSLLPHELLQLQRLELEQCSVSGPGEGWVAAPLHRALWALGASSLLSPDSFGGMTHPQLLICAMPLQQNSLNTTLLSSTSLVLCSFPFPASLRRNLPESPCFSQASLKSSNPTKHGKVFLSPPPKQGECCATDISTADKVVCPTQALQGWRMETSTASVPWTDAVLAEVEQS